MTRQFQLTKYLFTTIGFISLLITSCGQQNDSLLTSSRQNDPITLSEIRLDSSSFISFDIINNLKDSIKFYSYEQTENSKLLALSGNRSHNNSKGNSWRTSISCYASLPDTIVIAPNNKQRFFMKLPSKGVDTITAISKYDLIKPNAQTKTLGLYFIIQDNKVTQFKPDSTLIKLVDPWEYPPYSNYKD